MNITLTGNLVDNPILRFTANQVPVCKIRVASTDRTFKDGQWIDGDTTFIDVSAWRVLAENVNSSLVKGNRVVIVGKLKQRSYEKKEGGGTATVYEIEADEIAPSLRNQSATVSKVKGGSPQKAGMAALKENSTDEEWNAPF